MGALSAFATVFVIGYVVYKGIPTAVNFMDEEEERAKGHHRIQMDSDGHGPRTYKARRKIKRGMHH